MTGDYNSYLPGYLTIVYKCLFLSILIFLSINVCIFHDNSDGLIEDKQDITSS